MQNSKGKAIASLVCSIIGLVCAFFGWGAILTLVLGIVAVVLAVKARKANDESKGMATAGLVMGIISIVLGGIVVACVACAAACVGAAVGASGDAMNELNALAEEIGNLQ